MSLSQIVPTLALSRSGAVEIFIFPLRLFTDSRINNYITRMKKNNKSAYRNNGISWKNKKFMKMIYINIDIFISKQINKNILVDVKSINSNILMENLFLIFLLIYGRIINHK